MTSPTADVAAGERLAESSAPSPEDGARQAVERSFDPAHRAQGAAAEAGRAAMLNTRELGRGAQRTMEQAPDLWRQALQPFAAINYELSRVFDDAWRSLTGLTPAGALRPAYPWATNGFAALVGAPPIDVVETDRAYVLRLEIPGVRAEDLDLQLKDDTLVITGQKSEARDERAGAYRLSERRFGRFERVLPAPPDIDQDNVGAELRDGVLTITLPRENPGAREGRRIEIA